MTHTVDTARPVFADGSNDYFTKTDVTGIANSKLISGAIIIKPASASQSPFQRIFCSSVALDGTDGFFGMSIDSGNVVFFARRVDAGDIILNINTTTAPVGNTNWNIVYFAIDMASQANTHIYLADTAQTISFITFSNENLEFSNPAWMFFTNINPPNNLYHGDISDILIYPGQFIDWRIEANRRKLRIENASGNLNGGCPVDPGNDGSTPFGPVEFYLRRNPAEEGNPDSYNNRGTAGAFTLNGTFENSSSAPGDGCFVAEIKSFTMQASNARSAVPGGQESYAFTNADGVGNIQEN